MVHHFKDKWIESFSLRLWLFHISFINFPYAPCVKCGYFRKYEHWWHHVKHIMYIEHQLFTKHAYVRVGLKSFFFFWLKWKHYDQRTETKQNSLSSFHQDEISKSRGAPESQVKKPKPKLWVVNIYTLYEPNSCTLD